jgi:hypothetical protein
MMQKLFEDWRRHIGEENVEEGIENITPENLTIVLDAFEKFLKEPAVMTALLGGGIAAAVKVIEDKFGTTKSPTSPTRPAEMDRTLEEQEKNNPYAICTASVGRDDKKKYEKCVNSVKKQNRSKE